MNVKSPGQEIFESKEKSRIDFEYKFKLFLCGLIFAVLSFAIQHPIKEGGYILKIIEIISWFCLLLSGYFCLVWINRFPIRCVSILFHKLSQCLNRDWTDEILTWRLFFFSLFLLLTVKGIASFY